MIGLWFEGLVLQRSGRLLGAMAGVALTVALLGSIGTFIVASAASMTERAIADVVVDWQVQLAPGTSPPEIVGLVASATGHTALQQVGYADIAGLEAHTGGTVQTTGPGKILGIEAQYRGDFPGQIRPLVGSLDGPLVAQQTAANLHVVVGDALTVSRLGLPPVELRVAGVIELPNADSMFQAVGMPAGVAPQAPPDNVVLLPMAKWHELFDLQALARPDSVRMQMHVRLSHHTLSHDPETAYAQVLGMARNLEARIAGRGIVANNLAARLDGVRADALYAKVLFLFLGIPGAILAALLTVSVAASGADRRRQEQALLRTRGASTAQVLQLASVEAMLVGIGGIALGIAVGHVLSWLFLGVGSLDPTTLAWLAGAALAGALLAVSAMLIPAWIELRRRTVMAARMIVRPANASLWRRSYLDLFLLVISGLAFWLTASSGYQVVLAPEGVAAASVDYQAFVGPVFLWLGTGLLAMRLWSIGLDRCRWALSRALRPIARNLSDVVAASLGRERARVTRGIALVMLACSFATATAVFNTTYNAQSRIDAELTNGADVTVVGTTTAPAASRLAQLKSLPGVTAAQPMQHRFAYVGADLQDVYGIDPVHIGDATGMSDAYFGGGNARATLAALEATPDGLLVSQETVTDFQLLRGDQLNLRLLNAADNQYHAIPFHFVGVVREFPTAPRDSFLVANAAYIARHTGSDAAEIVLLRTSSGPGQIAAAARKLVESLAGAKVTDIGSTQRVIASSLTSVDLRGLTRLELGFAVLMISGAAGLVLALHLTERRRTFVILSALGAKNRHLGAFLWSEGALVFVGGVSAGLLTGFAVAQMLVKVLTGVFDPPPEALAVPWTYLMVLVTAALASTVCAVMGVQTVSRRRPVVEGLRDI